ncbi:hypothetical protein NSMM_330034 [Nitrosomonas mobilis]|uniref:Uncharacterized protein n=1 Tax=Nitrosomonas mobilis TaxID=51642 RepID=A0A1G5SCT8_9PROT|nr:hypothetical protein NSMM_330034 [Nitrosomonas mobilis]
MFIGDLIGIWGGLTHMKDRCSKKKNHVPLVINACLCDPGGAFFWDTRPCMPPLW